MSVMPIRAILSDLARFPTERLRHKIGTGHRHIPLVSNNFAKLDHRLTAPTRSRWRFAQPGKYCERMSEMPSMPLSSSHHANLRGDGIHHETLVL